MKTRLLKLAAAAATAASLMSAADTASAQEIQLTGPLAGAPACRHCRLYREGRLSFTPGMGVTLLNEYERTFFLAAKLEYNIFDFLGIGVFGGYGLINDNTDLTNKIQDTAPTNSRTATNLPLTMRSGGPKFDSQTGKMKLFLNPQASFSPFRGKLAIFQKIFTDTDLYVHGGAAFIQVQERADCPTQTCGDPAKGFGTNTRFAVAPTFGLGLTLYTSGLLSINIEYRAFPFSWNRGGFDSRGGPPDANFPDNKVDSTDRTFKFNQMVFLGVGLYLPTTPKVSD